MSPMSRNHELCIIRFLYFIILSYYKAAIVVLTDHFYRLYSIVSGTHLILIILLESIARLREGL